MRVSSLLGLLVAGLLVSLSSAQAGVAYPDPPGGWSYSYLANAGEDIFGDGSSFDALDGTWSHTNGSDVWDGSGLGGTFEAGVNAPGGAQIFSENGISFLRIQDTGDPRDFGYADPGNRKVYFGHDISQHGAPDDALDAGVTISFRARIPTAAKSTNPLDPLHRDGQGAAGPQPYPAAGDGYVTSDGGKGNFVIKQLNGGAFAFSLAVADDQGGGDPNGPKAGFNGLTMNEFNGNVISGNVNFGQGSGTNVLALDPTDWHEFWIVLRKDPANIGTHEALIYVDGSTTAQFFKITAGTGDDYGGIGYLAMGSTATPQNSALDVDFFSFKTEAVFPPGALANLPPELRDLAPERGARYQDAALGLKFTAVTQPPNSIPENGATLILNGQDRSASLVASGDIRARQFTFSQLQANQLYTGSIILADQAGRKSTNAIQFDTFVQVAVAQVEFLEYTTEPSLTLPAGPVRLFLSAGSTAEQLIRVERIEGTTPIVVGVFKIPNTGSLDSPQFAGLTDALGQPVVINGGDTATYRIRPYGTSNSAPKELLAVPSSDPVTPIYVAFLTPPADATGVWPDTMIRGEVVRASGAVAGNLLSLLLDNVNVTGSSVTATSGNSTRITFQPTEFLSIGNHDVEVGYPLANPEAVGSARSSFAVGNVPRLPASWATPATSVDGKPRGFTGRIHVARPDAPADLFPNNPERAANQLANLIIDPDTGSPFENLAAGLGGDGSFTEADTINYDENGIEVGLPGDRVFPNTEPADVNYIALQTVTYLNLPRGTHRLAVACDDGFVVWSGPSAAATTNQFGIRSPGGGTTEVSFDVLAEEAGIYAFRLIYFEGSGGADLEWYSIDPDIGERLPINAAGGIQAWQSRTGDGTETTPTPTLSISQEANGDVVITFTGALQAAETLSQAFVAVPNATSPLRIKPAELQPGRYYRSAN